MKRPDLQDDSEDTTFTVEQRAAAANKSTWVSVCVNIALSITQIAVGIFAKSQALIADGVHSLSDLVSDFVVLFASHHSKKDADEDHPYGHQRFETAASMVIGVLLIIVALGMLWAAFDKLHHPEDIPTVHGAALWIVGIALVSKELLFRYMLKIAKRVKSSMLPMLGMRALMPPHPLLSRSALLVTSRVIPFWIRLPPSLLA
jgi:cation diffusion facilitator family transporter